MAPPLPTLGDVFRRSIQGRTTSAPPFTLETVETVYTDGDYGIRGAKLKAVGRAIYRIGQQVPVLWARDGRSGVILAHSMRRSGGVVLQEVGTVVEELHIRATGSAGALEVWFRNASVFGRLLARDRIPLPVGDEIRSATWGLGDNMFFLEVGPPSSFNVRRFLIFALDRALGQTSTGLPGATFIRQVNEPTSLVIDPIIGTTFPTFDSGNHARLDAQLGIGATPASAPFVWTIRWRDNPVSVGSTTTLTSHAAVVEDVSGTASVVWSRAIAAVKTFVSTPRVLIHGDPEAVEPEADVFWGDPSGTTEVIESVVDIRIVEWDRRPSGTQSFAYARQWERTTYLTAVPVFPVIGPSGTAGMTTSNRVEARASVVIEALAGGVLFSDVLSSETTWAVAVTTQPTEPMLFVGPAFSVLIVTSAAALLAVSDGALLWRLTPVGYDISLGTFPAVTHVYDAVDRALRWGLVLLGATPPVSGTTEQRHTSSTGALTPPSLPAFEDVQLATHAVGLGIKPATVPTPWSIAPLRPLLARLGTAAPITPTQAQKEAAALKTITAEEWGGFSDVHVVYVPDVIAEVGAT